MAKRNTFFEDEKIEKKIDMKQLLRTLKYILPYKKILVLVSVMMLVAAVVSLLPPRLPGERAVCRKCGSFGCPFSLRT